MNLGRAGAGAMSAWSPTTITTRLETLADMDKVLQAIRR
ncbi:hypothetical protein Jab_2c21000 [Janthinobacterium sp. HH01]|nr:hypothetical protein Jab_2c21000 [Janthinobacterium sp. HH01]